MPPQAQLLLLLTLLRSPAGGDPQACPSSCFCDAQLSVTCNGDTLWSIPDDIPTGVRRLELRSFVVPILRPEHLVSFSNLTELKAQRNGISSIENGTFSALTGLVKLDLSQNSLSEITAGTLSDMSQAKNLDLSSNHLTLVEGAFVGLNSLEQLTLRSNNLTVLGANTLNGLQKLQYLNLDSNRISEIDISAFQPLASLAHLILSNNPLNNLSRLEFFGSRLQYIDVSAVGLTRVPQSLTQYVRDLRLAKNNLTILRRGDFDSYPYLGLLVLDDCGIQHLEEDTLGRHEHLMRLWLNGNLLQNVPVSLPASLKAVYLEENQIRVLHQDDFSGLSALQQLFMQRNLIDTVEGCAFCGLSSLTNLDLQANKIQHISANSFSGLTELESLDLSQNPITVLDPGSLAPLASLKSLQLSRLKNNISAPESLFDSLEHLVKLEMFDSAPLVTRVINSGRLLHGIRSVTHLNVMHNHLVRLRSDLPQLLPRLQLMKLGGSWWNCSDPDILWLTDWMAEGRVQFYSPFSARCRQPPRLMLKSVALLTDDDFETVPTRRPVDAPSSSTATTLALPESSEPTVSIPLTSQTSTTYSKPSTTSGVTATTPTTVITEATKPVIGTEVTTASSVATSASAMTTSPTVPTAASTLTMEITERTMTWPPTSSSSSSSSARSTQAAITTTPKTSTTPMSFTLPASTITQITSAVTPTPRDTTATTARSETTSMATSSVSPPARRPAGSQPPRAVGPLPGRRPVPIASSGGGPSQLPGRVNYVPTTATRRGSMVAVLSSLAAAVGVLLLILASAVALWRYRRGAVHPFTRRRKGSSISYSQQKDEVNILEEDCGAPAEGGGVVRDSCNGDSHHGLSNALYFMSQRTEAELGTAERPQRPGALLAHAGVDACPRALPDAWGTPSPDAAQW